MESVSKAVVESVSRDGKKLKIDGHWYSAFSVDSLSGANAGDTVSFSYVEKESGGVVYKNIRGKVTIHTSAPTAAGGGKGGGGYSRSEDPETARRICRQNALTNAVNFFNASRVPTGTNENLETEISTVLAIAGMFTRFSMGEFSADAGRNVGQVGGTSSMAGTLLAGAMPTKVSTKITLAEATLSPEEAQAEEARAMEVLHNLSRKAFP